MHKYEPYSTKTMHTKLMQRPNLTPATVIAYGTDMIPLPKLVETTAIAASATESPVFFAFHAFWKLSSSSMSGSLWVYVVLLIFNLNYKIL